MPEKTRPCPPVSVLTPDHPGWPATRLAELDRPPRWLEVEGRLPPLDRAVAVVGTRYCDPWARDFTRRLAEELAAHDCTIVSGGALGIDSAAHEGALLGQGPTLAVLPTSLDAPYPRENRALFSRIPQLGGGLLCEGGRKGPVRKHSFLERNRLIAALSQVVVVVQAPERSGALSTAAHARRLGRPLLAVPAAPWDSRGTGGLALLAEGARICRTASDVLSLVACRADESASKAPRRAKKSGQDQHFEPDEQSVLAALAGGPRGADELCEDVALPAAQVQRAVLMLLLAGAIQEVSSGRYRRTPAC